MRLICPNCGAQYAIDDGLIPETGREVQCSACGTLWFQAYAGSARDDDVPVFRRSTARAGDAAAPAPDTEAPRKPIDEAVLSVLREEAAREQDARRAERVVPESPAGAAPLPASPADTPPPVPEAVAEEGSSPPRERLRAVRRETLPDAEEITSTLRPPANTSAGQAEPASRHEPRPRRRSGLVLAILLFGGLTALYAQAERVSRALPQAAPALTEYVSAVDKGRLWLHDTVDALRKPAE